VGWEKCIILRHYTEELIERRPKGGLKARKHRTAVSSFYLSDATCLNRNVQFKTHKTTLHVHTSLIRLLQISTYDKVPDNAGDDNTEHDLCKVLSTTYASCLQKSDV
jgi:hypothetical protein